VPRQLANVKLGAAHAITELNATRPDVGLVPSAPRQGSATTLSPGETEVTINVSVVFDVAK
jgi:uncharacterized protein YggE